MSAVADPADLTGFEQPDTHLLLLPNRNREVDRAMEGLTCSTDLPRRRSSKTISLTPLSAWSVVSKPFHSNPKLSSGIMSSWADKQNEEAFSRNRRIFYVPGLTSINKSSDASGNYSRIGSDGTFKGMPVLTVDTSMPPTTSEVDLLTELDFWETVVPDKSPKPKEAETPLVSEQPEVLFDANDEHKLDQGELSDDELVHEDGAETEPPRPLLQADTNQPIGRYGSISKRQIL